MSDNGESKKEKYTGFLSKSKRKALIEAAANQAADKARKKMIAILAIKEVGKRTLSRGEIQVEVNLPTLGGRTLRGEPPWIGDWNAGDDFTIIDDDPTDAIIHSGPNGPIWWMDMTDSNDPT